VLNVVYISTALWVFRLRNDFTVLHLACSTHYASGWPCWVSFRVANPDWCSTTLL